MMYILFFFRAWQTPFQCHFVFKWIKKPLRVNINNYLKKPYLCILTLNPSICEIEWVTLSSYIDRNKWGLCNFRDRKSWSYLKWGNAAVLAALPVQATVVRFPTSLVKTEVYFYSSQDDESFTLVFPSVPSLPLRFTHADSGAITWHPLVPLI